VKIKCLRRQEFVIGGWTDPQRSRVGLGALLVGYYEGDRLQYAGKVGTGYTRETLLDLRRRFDGLARESSPFDSGEPPRGGDVHWLEPRLVAEVAFSEWTQNSILRQPRFEGLRPDKSPRECRREQPRPVAAVQAAAEAQGGARNETTGTRPGETNMALNEYRAKRSFDKTREPAGDQDQGQGRGNGKAHKRPIFVVQEHHASHLHYDFRLEADGVLKSWAVPKEPTLDPGQKRLAVQVEDHPLEYANFEGTIPEGQYGAGTVTIWDRGTYENLMARKPVPQSVTEAIEAGHLEIRLHGKKLRGKFALVRMKGRGRGKPQWLLIKMKDEFARSEPAAEKPVSESESSTNAKSSRRTRTSGAGKRNPASASSSARKVELTHPDKILFPEAGLTKRDVFRYYERIADRLLPYLKDRPATLERLPEGLTGPKAPHFWQKDTPDYYPDWIPRVALPTERGTTVHYVLVNDAATLLYLVNQGTITFHIWASRVQDLDRPDFVLFDLDPGKATFADAREVARALHAALDREGVDSFVKTSGKTGLHVLVPWTAPGGYDEARSWASEIARRVATENPDRATLEIRKASRGRRVYIDVLQNARGHHAVPPYVIRAVPAATISTPLKWSELTDSLDPASFTPKTIFRRLSRLKQDPWAELVKTISGAPPKSRGSRRAPARRSPATRGKDPVRV
jgi:bifunctional non-homologous end joining protein LigD